MKNSKQLYFEMPNKTSLGVEDYIVTDSNNFAFDLIVKMVKGEINFGLISGPPYSGKTHLSSILKTKTTIVVNKIATNVDGSILVIFGNSQMIYMVKATNITEYINVSPEIQTGSPTELIVLN